MHTMFSLKKQYLARYIELIIKYRVIWIPSVLTVFSFRTFTREVKVVQSYFNKYIAYSSFLSLCIGDNHGTVLEYIIFINFYTILRCRRTRAQIDVFF